ncbi:MAG: xanthine dehydrogenase family protein molybdopterin-binding subunit [Oscillospiraceae bacterium]|nr:xanthine dehydrogenase family protein molybdopterin-binding subunit [Oscillospiraceae bacterium]
MKPISKSVPKIDHCAKTRGLAEYVCDYDATGMLYGRILRSKHAKADVLSINLPAMPEGYDFIDHRRIPGLNRVHIVQDDTPVFAERTVEYIGDPIGIIVGPEEREVDRLLACIEVEYDILTPEFDARKSPVAFFEYGYEKGDIAIAFAHADRIYEESFETGRQEQMYLETNGMIAEYAQGKMLVHGTMQCPYYVHTAVAEATGLLPEDVIIAQDVTGGGFGGKEDYPSVLACQAAVAAYVTGKPVRVVLSRREDVEFTSKRHPAFCDIKAAVKDGRVTAMQIEAVYDAGAYTTMTPVVLQRGVIAGGGVYSIENLKVKGEARKTNTVPSGAFRGFGGPQMFFAVEMMMSHIAKDLGEDPLDFKLAHTAKLGDATSTSGMHHFNVPLPAMMDEVAQACDYRRKKEAYADQQGRLRKGIAMSAVYHGAGFTGIGERDIIKAVVRLRKDKDGYAEILVANTDIGQGLSTAFTKIVAQELGLPFDRVIIKLPDTGRVPNSGPTVASRSVMVVGELLRRAAARLKDEWLDGEEQVIEERYVHPDFMITFDIDKFQGDAYPTFSWAATAVEVEVDTFTGDIRILGAWGSYDIGTPIDENIAVGQMEGGLVQSLGYGMMESIAAVNGRIRNNSFSDYLIPTAVDFPAVDVSLHVEEYPEGPYGAKGAGELPLVGGAPATIEAIENAIGVKLSKTPFLPEDVVKALY